MDTQHLVTALAEALATSAVGDKPNEAAALAGRMAPALLNSIHFRAWLTERLEATWQLAEVHGFADQADDLCGGPLGARLASNGTRLS